MCFLDMHHASVVMLVPCCEHYFKTPWTYGSIVLVSFLFLFFVCLFGWLFFFVCLFLLVCTCHGKWPLCITAVLFSVQVLQFPPQLNHHPLLSIDLDTFVPYCSRYMPKHCSCTSCVQQISPARHLSFVPTWLVAEEKEKTLDLHSRAQTPRQGRPLQAEMSPD